MTYEEQQEAITNECFLGDAPRDCDGCPAHHTQGGRCCFGRGDYSEDDQECMDCHYKDDCAEATFQNLTHQEEEFEPVPMYRNIIPRRSSRLPIVGQPRPTRAASPSSDTALIQDTEAHNVEPMDLSEMSMPRQFLAHMGWGGVEGALSMGLRYFQRRRPR